MMLSDESGEIGCAVSKDRKEWITEDQVRDFGTKIFETLMNGMEDAIKEAELAPAKHEQFLKDLDTWTEKQCFAFANYRENPDATDQQRQLAYERGKKLRFDRDFHGKK
jgi:hypothetical protein